MRAEPSLTPRGARRRERAVIALPNPLTRALLTEMLHGSGYQVTEAIDGEQLLFYVLRAFDVEGAGGVDLVIADLWMPLHSGLDVLQSLRKAHWRTPVLILAADYDVSCGARIDALGAGLLAKPFTLGALRRAIREAQRRPVVRRARLVRPLVDGYPPAR
jgi:DNA-binding response OmpR family regulator